MKTKSRPIRRRFTYKQLERKAKHELGQIRKSWTIENNKFQDSHPLQVFKCALWFIPSDLVSIIYNYTETDKWQYSLRNSMRWPGMELVQSYLKRMNPCLELLPAVSTLKKQGIHAWIIGRGFCREELDPEQEDDDDDDDSMSDTKKKITMPKRRRLLALTFESEKDPCPLFKLPRREAMSKFSLRKKLDVWATIWGTPILRLDSFASNTDDELANTTFARTLRKFLFKYKPWIPPKKSIMS